MYSVTKEFNFCAAHQLPGHETCGVLHGHNYKVLVTFASDTLNDYGMVIDFGRIKNVVGPFIDHLDHSNLNEIMEDVLSHPTAENIAWYIYTKLLTTKDVYIVRRLRSVTVYETPTSYATYSKKECAC
jgi:6-pyruvoyltetrahydropterin/6-carboxytetrahydropterin synthase